MLEPGHVLDLYDDAEGTFIKNGGILEKYGKALEVEAPDALKALPDRDFALVILTKTGEKHRKYPVHTPDSLAISTHYFEQVGFGLPKEAQVVAATNLVKAHLRYGAEPPEDLKKLASKEIVSSLWSEDRAGLDVEVRTFVQHEKYAMRRTMADESVLELFPVDTLEAAQASASEFKKVAFQMPAGDRFHAALALKARLDELGKPDADLAKFASLTPNPAFMVHLAARKPYLKDDESKATLDKLASISGALPGVKLAQALEAFDKKAGIAYLWDIRIRNPWDSCYTSKEASVKVGGKDITKTALVGLCDSGKLKPFFKTSMIEAMKKQPMEIFESLPNPTKETIASLL